MTKKFEKKMLHYSNRKKVATSEGREGDETGRGSKKTGKPWFKDGNSRSRLQGTSMSRATEPSRFSSVKVEYLCWGRSGKIYFQKLKRLLGFGKKKGLPESKQESKKDTGGVGGGGGGGGGGEKKNFHTRAG